MWNAISLVSPCPFPTTVTITPRAPPLSIKFIIKQSLSNTSIFVSSFNLNSLFNFFSSHFLSFFFNTHFSELILFKPLPGGFFSPLCWSLRAHGRTGFDCVAVGRTVRPTLKRLSHTKSIQIYSYPGNQHVNSLQKSMPGVFSKALWTHTFI